MTAVSAGECRRIVLLFAHLHKGGMQKVASGLSLAFPAKFEQSVLFFGTEEPGFPFRGALIDLGCRGRMSHGVIRRLLNFLLRWVRLQTAILRQRVDTVVSFGEIANTLNTVTWGKRTVLSVHAPIDRSLRGAPMWYGRAYRLAVRLLYRRANAVVAVSQGIADRLVHEYQVPRRVVRVIYNGCDQPAIRRLAREPLEGNRKDLFRSLTVIAVGSLENEKGHDLLLRAYAIARRRMTSLQLILVGEGSRRLSLESLAGELGVAETVHFFGFVPNPHKYVASSTLFVLPSRYEGFGLALLEAMACGTPCVATDCDFGPRELVGHSGAALLVPDPGRCNDEVVIEGLSDAIIGLASSEALRQSYARRGAGRAAEFSLAAHASAWAELL